ncbi:MAG: ABC transporter substrate-binding protein [Pigmentiphaga sp.]|uniref:ABC transporter substrate-binding protein n=1 Tax=Pigmentiphaga sp. TaxID=1977564 RepID=UPI0029BF316B|nr:ABC transporter substrate-binding protein [Pigmentiphaga sp.]MDX3907436.1 ABC transporter substrate-binding protein [Pigmentiphaga sp.]
MAKLRVTVATTVTDRTQAILDGRIPINGCDVIPLPGGAQDIFRRTLNDKAFDIAELSMSSYLVAASRGDQDYVAIPVYLSRAFRHSSIYIRKDRAIACGADLADKQVGVIQYQQTAGLWVRGILRDEHGLDTARVRWRTGGLDVPSTAGERTRIQPPPGIDLQPIAAHKTLNGMLIAGELDALIVPPVPASMHTHPELVGRLFPDHVAVEQAYFRRTGIFPIMHTVVIRRELCEAYPWLPREVYDAFTTAKAQALTELGQANINRVALPWIAADTARAREVMGDRMWAYGLTASRHELDAMLRYSETDGLLSRTMKPEDLFHPSTHRLADRH